MKNSRHIITTQTVTYAMMAQRILSENGIPSRIVRPSDEAVARGCVYGIEIDSADRAAAKSALVRGGVPCRA